MKCYLTPVPSPPKPNQSGPPSIRPFFFTSIQTLFPPTFFPLRTLQASQGFSFHSSFSSDTKGGSQVPINCHLASKKNWTCFLSKINHQGEELMSCAGISNGCQKDGFIMVALEFSVLEGLKMQKTMYSKCMVIETKPFPGIMIVVWEPLFIIIEL